MRDGWLPSDSEHKQQAGLLGLHSSLQSIQPAHNGSDA